MVFQIIKGLFGIALVVVACLALVTAISERKEAERLWTAGGSENVFFAKRKMTVNAKFLAVMMFLVPTVILASGVWMCLSAVNSNDETA